MSGTLGIITARGGSKGLPGKNIRPLAGRPLLAWSIAAAQASGVIDAVILSTDDPEIARAGREHGADVPFPRPAALAQDDTSSIDVVLHALDWLAMHRGFEPEWVFLLQPTSPLRRGEHLRAGYEAALAAGADGAVGVVRPKHHPGWCFTVGADGMLAPMAGAALVRRQELPGALALNGALYVTRTEALRAGRTFVPPRCVPVEMSAVESLDIDSLEDWVTCEALLAAGLATLPG